MLREDSEKRGIIMKKQLLITMALLTAVCVSGTPLTAKAAGNCQSRPIAILWNKGCSNIPFSQKELYSMLENYVSQNYPQFQIQWPAENENQTCKDCEPQGNENQTCKDCEPQENESQTCEDCEPQENENQTCEDCEPSQPESTTVETQENATYEEQVVALVNAERAKEGLPALKVDSTLQAAALARAKETVQLFSHTRPNGTSCFSILKEYGISYRSAGENIAYGQRSPEEVVNAWMNSEGHRANILNKDFTTIGIGYYQAPNGTKYWSQLFLA